MEVTKPQSNEQVSLSEAYRTVPIPQGASWFRRMLAFAGPGFMVSVGYMDPGNWATDLQGGSKFGYTLIWVIMISNLMAIFLQTLCARLGLVTGKDLAQACRDYYCKPVAVALWLTCEVAIIACDLAEVIGSAVALKLLFQIPLVWGVIITSLDVLILLGLMRYGFRKLEAVVVSLVFTVAACFVMNIWLARPEWGGVLLGFRPILPNAEALYISLGILGATVMPHNLYLHSSIVQTRDTAKEGMGLKQAIRWNTFDTVFALGAAFFVNAAILILAGSAFHRGGVEVTELEQAHQMLTPLLGGASATAFAIALLASGQSSTITGTLAGQIVMEGFLRVKVAPWLRRAVTRGIAIVPALVLITAKGGNGTVDLLVLSQVVLSMQLSFATFPLVMFTSDKSKMGEHANPFWAKITGYAICFAIALLNMYLLHQLIGGLWLGVAIGVVILFAGWVKWGYRGK
ncbi:divalent metal cation transporter MntH [Armatimonadota bacterium]|nr:divalent metal cation transporter MntH [Armatimonadota bacterium]